MAKKRISFGTVGPVGNQVSWAAEVDDDTLAAGRSTGFTVEVTRTAGPAIVAPGVTVTVLKLPLGGPVSIDAPGPNLASGAANVLQPGETQAIDFQITNAPGGATPASYLLVLFISYAGSGVIPPALFTVGAPF